MSQSVPFIPSMISSCILWLDPSDGTTVTTAAGIGSQVTRILNKGSLSNIFASNAQATGTVDAPWTGYPPPGTTTYGTDVFGTSPLSTISFTQTAGSGGIYGNGFNGSYLRISGVQLTNKSRTVFAVYGAKSGGSDTYARIIGTTTMTSGTNSNQTGYFDTFNGNYGIYPVNYTGESLFAGGYNPVSPLSNSGIPYVLCLRHGISVNQNYGSANGNKANLTANNALVNGYRTGTDEFMVGIGLAYTRPFFLGEIIYFDRALNDNEVKKMEAYLTYKWNIQTQLPSTNFAFAPPPSFLPNQVVGANLRLWFDANDSTTLFSDTGATTRASQGGTVARWNDKSGLGNYLLQNTAGSRPTLSVIPATSLPSVYFATQTLQMTTLNNNTQSGNLARSVFLVQHMPNSSAIVRVATGPHTATTPPNTFGIDNNGPAGALYNPFVYSASDLIYGCILTGTSLLYSYYDPSVSFIGGGYNGMRNLSNSTTLNTTATPWYFGLRPDTGGCVTGYICEFLLYDAVLSETQRQQVQSYLMFKWSIPQTLWTSIPYNSYYLGQPTGSNILNTIQLNLVNTLGTSGILTLPSTNAIQGRALIFKDQYGSFSTNNLFITTNNANQTIDSAITSTINTTSLGWQSFIAGNNNKWYTVGGTLINTVTTSTIKSLGVSTNFISSGNLFTSTLALRDQTVPASTNTLSVQSTFLIYNTGLQSTIISGTRQSFGGLFLITRSTFLPNQITNLILWLDSSNVNTTSPTSGSLIRWNDSSSLANNVTEIPTPAPRVTNNGILYSASGPNVTRANLSATYTNTGSAFIVASYNSNSGTPIFQPRLFMAGNSTDGTEFRPLFILLSAQNTTPGISTYVNNLTPNINPTGQGGNLATYVPINYSSNFLFSCVGSYSGTTVSINTFINGNTQPFSAYNGSVTDTTRQNYLRYSIGGYLVTTTGINQDAYNGNVNEIIVYSSALNTTQRQQVEGYLAWKWGLVKELPASHPFKNAPP